MSPLTVLAVAFSVAGQPQTPAGQETAAPAAPVGQERRGVEADRIENVTINNYGPRPRDPQRRALGAVMVRFGTQMNQALEPFRTGNAHLILYDPRDPYFAGQLDRVYVFAIVPAELLEGADGDVCVFQSGFALVGLVATAQGDGQVNVDSRPIPLEDLLFQAVCDSLGADARQAWGGAPSADADSPQLTNYDVLSRGRRDRQVIVLMSGLRDGQPYEQRALREYWAEAFTGMDPTAPEDSTERMLQRELGPVVAAATRARADETGISTFSIDRAAFARLRSFDAVADGARRYFGRAFEEFDAAWTRGLAIATLTIDGQARLAMTGATFQPPLERFRVSEIGSPRFWRHFSDGADFMQSVHCLAVRFAVDQDYAIAADMPGYANCEAAPPIQARTRAADGTRQPADR